MQSKEYTEGFESITDSAALNPYKEGTVEFEEWNRGRDYAASLMWDNFR